MSKIRQVIRKKKCLLVCHVALKENLTEIVRHILLPDYANVQKEKLICWTEDIGGGICCFQYSAVTGNEI